MFSGTLRTRDRVRFGKDHQAKVTAIAVFDRGSAHPCASVTNGQIAKVWGLGDVRIGDSIGDARTTAPQRFFAPPTLETVVVPSRPSDKGALHVALTQVAEQDPLINLRQDDIRQEIYVSLYGEVQKEVIQATLAVDYQLDVTFRETTTICVERPAGTGEAIELLGKEPNPFLATVGLRVEPAPPDSGVTFELDVKIETVPIHVYKTVEDFRGALEDAVRETLQHGIHGWQVTDCVVTMYESGFTSPGTGPGDFRKLVPLVLMSALQEAGTAVCEPIHRFQLEIPADTLGGDAAGPRPVASRPGHPGRPWHGGHAGGHDPGGSRTRVAATAAGADPWRGRPRVRVRPPPSGRRRHTAVPAADGPQPAQPQGVPSTRPARRLVLRGSGPARVWSCEGLADPHSCRDPRSMPGGSAVGRGVAV